MNNEEIWLLNEKYGGEKSKAFFDDIKRLNAGEPLAYIIGSVPFLNTTIFLDSRPLIPRAETEFWTEAVITDVRRGGEAAAPTILDLCAGSGCIGIALKKALPLATVDFAEIDEVHHETIKKNWHKNIDLLEPTIFGGNLFAHIPEGTYYDIIVTNPPYIDPVLDRAELSVKTHEPHVALYGGVRGMQVIEQILTNAVRFLSSTGTLYIEHEPEQEAEIHALALLHHFDAVTYPDQYGVQRYTTLMQRS